MSDMRIPLADLLAGKRLLIFDFDGTVADTSPLHAAAFQEVLAPFGVEVDYPSIAGRRTREAMLMCLARASLQLPPEEVDDLTRRKQRMVREMFADRLQPLPGVDPFLRWAKDRYPLAMATSGSRESVKLALTVLGYSSWFRPLLCAEDFVQSKPHPEPFERVLEGARTNAADAVVFEDSEAGFESARAAGIDCVDARQNLWLMLGSTTP